MREEKTEDHDLLLARVIAADTLTPMPCELREKFLDGRGDNHSGVRCALAALRSRAEPERAKIVNWLIEDYPDEMLKVHARKIATRIARGEHLK